MPTVTVTRCGNLVGFADEADGPLPRDVRGLIEPELTYTYTKRLFGYGRRDPATGYDRPFHVEERRQYRYDADGRLCCSIGFLPRLSRLLAGHGYAVRQFDRSPPRERPGCYDVDYDAVVSFAYRARQEEAVARVLAHPCGVITAPPAFGKTFLVRALGKAMPKARVHVVTKRKDIVKGLVSELSLAFPNVGQIGAGKKKTGRVTVITADSLHLSDGDCDILLADEVHELLADTYAAELARYRFSRNYGFTATPKGRKDGTDARLEALFGPVIFEMSYPEAVALGLVVPIEVRWLDVPGPHNPCAGKADTAKKRWGVWRNHERNAIIADAVRTYADEQVLILVETTEHALYLRRHLPEYALCYSEKGMDPDLLEMYRRQGLMEKDETPIDARERDRRRLAFERGELRKVIATGVWSTGVDFTGLQVLVRADAMESEIMDFQAPGRVCRLPNADRLENAGDADKTHGVVIDLRDQFDPGLHRKARKRERNYANKGWKQEHVRRLAARP